MPRKVGAVTWCWLCIVQTRGTDMQVLCFDLKPASARRSASGASPFTRTVTSFESTFLMLAYDIGGATSGVANVEGTNSAYSAGSDRTLTIVSLAIDF